MKYKPNEISRRDFVRGGLAAAALVLYGCDDGTGIITQPKDDQPNDDNPSDKGIFGLKPGAYSLLKMPAGLKLTGASNIRVSNLEKSLSSVSDGTTIKMAYTTIPVLANVSGGGFVKYPSYTKAEASAQSIIIGEFDNSDIGPVLTIPSGKFSTGYASLSIGGGVKPRGLMADTLPLADKSLFSSNAMDEIWTTGTSVEEQQLLFGPNQEYRGIQDLHLASDGSVYGVESSLRYNSGGANFTVSRNKRVIKINPVNGSVSVVAEIPTQTTVSTGRFMPIESSLFLSLDEKLGISEGVDGKIYVWDTLE